MSESRTRSRSGPDTIADLVLTITQPGVPTIVYDPYYSVNYGGRYEEMHDWITPGFQQKIAEGAIINHPCNYSVSEAKPITECVTTGKELISPYKTFYWTGQGYTAWLKAQASPHGPYPENGIDYAAGVQQAKLQALRNIDRTPYAFGEDLFEIGETIKFLKSPFRSMADLALSFRRSFKKKSTDPTQNKAKLIASTWAEYHWAFLPLVRSSYDAVEALSVVQNEPPERSTARGFHTENSPEKTEDTVVPYWTGSYSLKKTVRAEYSCHAYIMYAVSNPCLDWRRTVGLRSKDFPLTLWQIFPLSFMIDRVVDISSAITGLVNLSDPNIRLLASGVRTKLEEIRTEQVHSETYTNWSYAGSADIVENRSFVYDRGPWIPTLSDVIPPVTLGELVKDVNSILDLAAITIQRLTK